MNEEANNDGVLDFVAIGDIVTDAFIELEDAWVETDNPTKSKELCMRFGDKIPYKDVVIVPAVGNSPNASVAAHRLGLNSAIITNIGDDQHGAECLGSLRHEGVSTEFVEMHAGLPTNYHYVLRFGAERTILVKHTHYQYEFPNHELSERKPKWLYLSSLAENSLEYHDQITRWLDQNPNTKLAFQPGTFQIKLGYEKLAGIYQKSEIFFCNKEESEKILGIEGSKNTKSVKGAKNAKSKELKELLDKMRELGPKIVVITDGPNGAYCSDGKEYLFMPMYPDPKPPISRTGAGDSFSSTFTSAIILGKSLSEALMWGPINSMSVVQQIGAQKGLLSRDEILKYIDEAPDFYKVSEL